MAYRALAGAVPEPTLASQLQPVRVLALQSFGAGGNRRAFMGADYVAGVLEINNLPALGFVALYEQETKLLLAQQWSRPDGYFRFERVDANRKCFVVGFDPLTGDQAVIYDRI